MSSGMFSPPLPSVANVWTHTSREREKIRKGLVSLFAKVTLADLGSRCLSVQCVAANWLEMPDFLATFLTRFDH